MSGPVPKRSSERRRRNMSGDAECGDSGGAVEQARAPEEWARIARAWAAALAESGQAQFYEPSDWRTAQYVAEAMSRNLESGRFSGQLFAAVMSAMTDLLTTEGSRRRARLEIERGEVVEEQPVTAISENRKRLAGG